MEKKNNIRPLPTAQKDLTKAIQEGTEEPSVENLMIALSQSKATIQNLRNQIKQMAEGYRDLQIRLATTEFQHRLDFLWKVLFTENSEVYFGSEFLMKCAEEFKEMMFPQVAEETPVEENNV